MRTVILASASPRRKALLEQIGLEFSVDPSGHDETRRPDLPPRLQAEQLSLEKARAVAARHEGALIITGDTLGVLDGAIVGKPRTPAEAAGILTSLAGKTHLVVTGFTIMDTQSGRTVTRSVETRVHFRELTRDQIDAYVGTGEPLDKAGAYAIQGLGALLVAGIDGDFYNVMGLPLGALAEELRGFGVDVLQAGGASPR